VRFFIAGVAAVILAGCGATTKTSTVASRAAAVPTQPAPAPAGASCWTSDGQTYVELFPASCGEWDKLSSGPRAYWRPSGPPREGQRFCSLSKGSEAVIVEAERVLAAGPESICGELVAQGWSTDEPAERALAESKRREWQARERAREEKEATEKRHDQEEAARQKPKQEAEERATEKRVQAEHEGAEREERRAQHEAATNEEKALKGEG
jgi:flagellar biosynthesis GTPase FlhF